jgi:transposase
MAASQRFGGIAVANAPRDIALRPTGERWTVPHEDARIAPLVTQRQAVGPARLVLEAPGGFQRAGGAALAAAALPVVVVTPRHARDFAKATGQLAKTAVLDARAVAHCAEAVRPPPAPAARRADRRPAGPPGLAPATRGHAHGGEQPPGERAAAGPSGSPGA